MSGSVDLSTCRVGYALNPKKLRKSEESVHNYNAGNRIFKQGTVPTPDRWMGGGLADILRAHDNTGENNVDGVIFTAWDWEQSQSTQPEFDVIIHKLTEDLDKPESIGKLEALATYLKLHPMTTIVDPIENVRSVVSRVRCCEKLGNIIVNASCTSHEKCPVSQPRYFVADVGSDEFPGFPFLMDQHEMHFPVICKPIIACGTPESHFMVVVVNPDGFRLVTRPSIVQQYYDHDANFFKVYVIGSDVMIFQRPSLPNLVQDSVAGRHSMQSVAFDSRYAYPTLGEFLVWDKDSCDECDVQSNRASDVVDSKRICSQGAANDLSKIFPQAGDELIKLDSFGSCVGSSPTNKGNRKRKPTANDLQTLSPGNVRRVQPSLNCIPELNIGGVAVTDSTCNEQAASCAITTKHAVIGPVGSMIGDNVDISLVEAVEHSTILIGGGTRDSGASVDEASFLIPRARFENAAMAISKEFGLSLFGFDVIIPSESLTGEDIELVVIDVNFFPSYKEVFDFPRRLRAFLKSKRQTDVAISAEKE